MDRRRPGLRARRTASRSKRCRTGSKDAAKPDERLPALHAGRPRAEPRPRSLPAVTAAALRGARLPEAHELGRLARRRQGRLPVRPADPLDRRCCSTAAVVPVRDLRAGGRRAKGRSRRRERRPQPCGHRFLPRGAAGRPLDGALASPTCEASLARRASCCSIRPSAGARIERGLGAPRAARRPATTTGSRAEWARPRRAPDRGGGERSRRSSGRCRAEVLETVLVHHQKYVPLVEGGTRRRGSRP